MSNKKKQKGVLTLDFIFSFLAVQGVAMVLAVLCVALMLIEVGQYVAFSVNRAHISGHLTLQEQRALAQEKFNQITDKLKPFFSKGSTGAWVSVGLSNEFADNLEGERFDAPSGLSKTQKKYGYSLNLTLNFLKRLRLPLIGSPSDGAQTNNFGKVKLHSFLYREPTTQECLNFNQNRWKEIFKRFPNIGTMPEAQEGGSHGGQADNGC